MFFVIFSGETNGKAKKIALAKKGNTRQLFPHLTNRRTPMKNTLRVITAWPCFYAGSLSTVLRSARGQTGYIREI
jgi:hypothetical protein